MSLLIAYSFFFLNSTFPYYLMNHLPLLSNFTSRIIRLLYSSYQCMALIATRIQTIVLFCCCQTINNQFLLINYYQSKKIAFECVISDVILIAWLGLKVKTRLDIILSSPVFIHIYSTIVLTVINKFLYLVFLIYIY